MGIFFQFLILLVFIQPFCINAQANNVDSLVNKLLMMEDKNSLEDLDLKSIICNSIAVCYQNTEENNKARFYFLQSIHFAKQRINESNDWSDPQNNYDIAYLYKNMAVFEASIGNYLISKEYLDKSGVYYQKLKTTLPLEDYNEIIVGFYATHITFAFHSGNYALGEEYIEKSLEIMKRADWSLSDRAELYRIQGEFFNAQKKYEAAETLFLKALDLIDQENDKTDINEHEFIHSLISAKFYAGKFQEIIDFFAKRKFYRTIEEVKRCVHDNQIVGLSHFINNLFILSFVNIRSYQITHDLVFLETGFQWQKMAFNLAEENTLKNGAEKIGSILVNSKNKISALLRTLDILQKENKIQKADIFEVLRIIDVNHSTQLHLERSSYAVNRDLWETQKELKHELNYVNLKLEESSVSGNGNVKMDSLRELSYQLTLKLQEIGLSTKKDKILDEYRIGQGGFENLLTRYAEKTNKNILTYFYSEDFDSLFVIGINADTSFISGVETSSEFVDNIKELFELNSHLQHSASRIARQKELNKAFYQSCFGSIEANLNSKELLIYPIDEMSYISFDALINENDQYLVQEYSVHYTTSLFSVISKQEKKTKTDGFVSFYPGNYGTDSLTYLYNAKQEVEGIQSILKGEILGQEKATKTHFLERSKSTKIVHFASHSILNPTHPYESFLVFDAAIDSSNNKLYAYEIFSKSLNADLITLSSCNSAQGEIEEGIGIVSLSNALYFAGVPSIVSSLWSAQDKSSSKIMVSFYTKLKLGLTKSESLRRAKIDYLENADNLKKQPFFWANYVVYGSDQSLFEKDGSASWWKYLIGTGLLAVLLILGRKLF